jgi:hypothetical protein
MTGSSVEPTRMTWMTAHLVRLRPFCFGKLYVVKQRHVVSSMDLLRHLLRHLSDEKRKKWRKKMGEHLGEHTKQDDSDAHGKRLRGVRATSREGRLGGSCVVQCAHVHA